ncbi:uncharacterized protein LOC143021181 [Oratosquilla oratoria]|uniref:uncharacterized protein LOC143021181 n=1 Tax=Oratosquilla oratoria TaxID=337810 RepID=UPI003F760242
MGEVRNDESLEITSNEVKAAIKRMKNGKSAGCDGLPAEIFKEGEETLLPYLVSMFNAAYKTATVPAEWRRSTTDLIFALRMLVEKAWEWNVEEHMIFLDLQKAFDRVPRRKLWVCLRIPSMRFELVLQLELMNKLELELDSNLEKL